MTMTQIDPDNNFYENAKIDCQYYTDDKLNATVKYENGFSIVHFNCRSLPVNFKRVIKESLTELKNNVDIVALTETWLNEIDKEDYVINGYETYHIVQQSRKGGRVAIYIKNGINYKIIDVFCTVKEIFLNVSRWNCMES